MLNLCVENMLCTNQKGLKDYLAESKSHKIVIERIDEHGYTWLFMPYNPVVLQKIVSDTLDAEEGTNWKIKMFLKSIK